MALRPRVTVLLVVAGLAAVAGAAFATTYPRLSDHHDTLEARWRDLRPALSSRYDYAERLAVALSAARPELTVAGDLGKAVDAWSRAASSVERGPSAANRVEGLAARAARIVMASAQLRSDPAMVDTVRALIRTLPTDELDAYAAAVDDYDGARGRFPGRWLASILGFETVSTVDAPAAFDDLELPQPTTTTTTATAPDDGAETS